MVVDVIERFSQQAPAAMLFRGLFARVFSAEAMDQIFRDHKQRQVESETVFSSLIHLLAPVVSGGKPSVHASYQEREEQLGVSKQAVYDKLQGVEPQVSAALVRVPAQELEQVLIQAKATKSDPLPGFHTFVIDGKRLDATEHRLQETRRMKSAPLPGTVVALLDTRTEMFVEVACHPDAYACERKVVLPLLKKLERGALYLVDRNFCDGPLIERFIQGEVFFIMRHHGRSPRWRKAAGSRLRKVGQDSREGTVYEQDVEVFLPDGSWHRLRRITVKLAKATRDGDTELHLLTNLPESVLGTAISETYVKRWTIETCLGYLAQALNAEINTLAYPGAAILCFCLALVLFNIISALKTLLLKFSTASDKPDLSYYYLALEIAEARLGMEITIASSYWKQCETMSLSEFVAWLQRIARTANLRKYRRHARGPKRPPPKRASGKKRAHVSSHRILEERQMLA
jgi:Transposase DDE domain